MSITKKTPEQTSSLKATLQANAHITEVYFDKQGNHFFNAFAHEGKQFSRVEQERVVHGYRGQEAIVKTVGKVKAENEITETLSREDVLWYGTEELKEAKASSKQK